MGDAPAVLRPATARDLPWLRAMLLEAAFWRPGPRPPPDRALARPDLARWVEGWGRPGDTGVVAELDGEPAGAAWYRLWTSEHHAYGFVDSETPELAIGVRADARGRGVGTALLTGLAARARSQGHPRLSLSVERENPALRLYRRLGFRRVDTAGGALTLVLELER